MKKLLTALAVAMIASGMFAEVRKYEIPYYEKGCPRRGNLKYLDERCKLDLRLPSKEKGFPTVVWFHGGGLTGGKKFFPARFNAEKIAVAAVNYRLSGPRAACPDYLHDAAAATAWVLKHISEYGGDPNRVYLAGHSAGGYLCAMLALDKRYLELFGVSPMSLAGVFPLSGEMTTHFQILNERRAKNPGTPKILLDEYAPIFVAGKESPPICLIVGDSRIEWPARVEENRLLAARMQRIMKNNRVEFYSMDGFNHGTMLEPGILLANRIILNKSQKKVRKSQKGH